jgi:hypothetical protein
VVSDDDFQALVKRILVLEAMLLASSEGISVEAPPVGKHHWAAVLDHGGQVPVYMPVDARAKPLRMIATTRGDSLELHFQCGRCGERGMRKFAVKARTDGPHRNHYDFSEVVSLPEGPCAGHAQEKPRGLFARVVRLLRGEPAVVPQEQEIGS